MSVPVAPAGMLLDIAASQPAVDVAALLAPGGALLVLAPHPDDESLGCGAALMAALARGVPVIVALLTDGGASHPGSRTHPPAALMALRRAEFAAAVAELEHGARARGAPRRTVDVVRLSLPDTAVATAATGAARTLCALARERGAATVWSTWRHDPHADHEAAARIADAVEAALGAVRPVVRRDYAVWGRFGEAGRNAPSGTVLRFELGRFAGAKQAAMARYVSQFTPLIADDPDGFTMPAALVDHFGSAPEVFVAAAAP